MHERGHDRDRQSDHRTRDVRAHRDRLGHLGRQVLQHRQDALVSLVAVLDRKLPRLGLRKNL